MLQYDNLPSKDVARPCANILYSRPASYDYTLCKHKLCEILFYCMHHFLKVFDIQWFLHTG